MKNIKVNWRKVAIWVTAWAVGASIAVLTPMVLYSSKSRWNIRSALGC